MVTQQTSDANAPPVAAATVRECLQEAAGFGRLPGEERQFLRILLDSPGDD